MRGGAPAAVFALLLLGSSAASQLANGANEASETNGANGVNGADEADEPGSATAVVEAFHALLLGCMKEGDELGFAGRYERIEARLDETFDMRFMSRAAVSRTWKELDAEQRAQFLDVSRRLTASRYADNFSGYGGQHFETLEVEPAARSTVLVKTQLVQPKDRDVRFDYRLRRLDTGWRVIDVQLEGTISELALRRGQYRSVIERDGFAELVDALEERIDELETE